MVTRYLQVAAAALLLSLNSSCCEDCGGGVPLPPGDLITLTSAQAALLVDRVESFGSSDPSLAALSDTVEYVIKAGAEARRIDVTTDIGSGPFWAVSMHLPNTMSSPASSTFHVIAFNEPSNPTLFLILGGWSQGSGSNPPSSVTGSLSGPTSSTSVTAHLFSVSNDQVSVWHATGGTSALTANATSQSCPGFNTPGLTCVQSTMDASFAITTSVAGQGSAATGQRTASGTVTSIPGIRLSM